MKKVFGKLIIIEFAKLRPPMCAIRTSVVYAPTCQRARSMLIFQLGMSTRQRHANF